MAQQTASDSQTQPAVVDAYLRELVGTVAMLPTALLMEVVQALHCARVDTKTVFIMGNGGSSATASHFVCDLAKGTAVPGSPRFKAIALTDNVPLLTAWGNDTDYNNIFADQLANLAGPGDVVIGISGSGNSGNVLKAIDAGREIGAVTIGLTGCGGGKLKDIVDIAVVVPNDCIEQVEDVHLVAVHAICTALRHRVQEERDFNVRFRLACPHLDILTQHSLRSLVRELTQCLQVTMCQVLLLNQARSSLTVWYSWPIRYLSSMPARGELIPLAEAADHAEALHAKQPVVLRRSHLEGTRGLPPSGTAATDGFASVGLVPLVLGEEVWGLISMHEMRSWERSPITAEKIDLCRRLIREAATDIQFGDEDKRLSLVNAESAERQSQ